MTDGGGRDEQVHGSGHAGVAILCVTGSPTSLCSLVRPSEHPGHQSHQGALGRGEPASLQCSVACRFYRPGLMIGVVVTNVAH